MSADVSDAMGHHFNLIEEIQISGVHGTYAASGALLLWLVGLILLFDRTSRRVRIVYLIACFFPCLLGTLGFIASLGKAVSVLGVAGMTKGLMLLRAIGEFSLPLSFGLIGSGVALGLAGILWLLPEKPRAK